MKAADGYYFVKTAPPMRLHTFTNPTPHYEDHSSVKDHLNKTGPEHRPSQKHTQHHKGPHEDLDLDDDHHHYQDHH